MTSDAGRREGGGPGVLGRDRGYHSVAGADGRVCTIQAVRPSYCVLRALGFVSFTRVWKEWFTGARDLTHSSEGGVRKATPEGTQGSTVYLKAFISCESARLRRRLRGNKRDESHGPSGI